MAHSHASADALLALVFDGAPLSASMQRHLDGCRFCQRRLTDYQQTNISLFARLYRRHCPSASTLSYYCLPGVLPDEERTLLTEHLARCPLCTSELAETQRFLGGTRGTYTDWL